MVNPLVECVEFRRRALVSSCLVALAVLAAGSGGVRAQALANPPQASAQDALSARFEVSAQAVRASKGGDLTATVLLSRPSPRAVEVAFQTSGTAIAGVDYVIDQSPLVVPPGETRADLHVTIRPATTPDTDKSLFITLVPGQPRGPSLVGVASHDGIGGPFSSHVVHLAPIELGDPLPGLTGAELTSFNKGRETFEHRFTPSEGLGPFYNATSCESCHSKPVTGGAADLYRNFYLAVYQFGPTLPQQSASIPPFLSAVVPAFGSGVDHATTTQFTLEGGRPLIPDTVFGFPVLSAQRNSIPIFGVGSFEFVSNATILSHADPDDLDGNGVSGRANTALAGTAMGRLGVKSQSNNIELFTRAPLQNQMGITTNPFMGPGSIVSLPLSPVQVSGDPNAPTFDHDPVADPELSSERLGDLIAFTRFLAPPVPKPFDADAAAGAAIFSQVRCTDCHIPSLPSSKGPVRAYSDLLIHFMGDTLVDKLKFGEAPTTTTDFRTQPLWGVSHFAPYLHDGRAPTIMDAIQMHAGEAQTSHDLFMALTEAQRLQVIVFLEHL